MIASAGNDVAIPVGRETICGDLYVPDKAGGLVIFAHGSGSSRFSARNRRVATLLNREGFATVLLDLLTKAEEAVDVNTAQYRFDIERLAHRVGAAVDWTRLNARTGDLPVGCFGASTGAAAALVAAADRPASVMAVVSRGGRPDLAGDALARVSAPTLLIVGGRDRDVIEMNRAAMRGMRAPVQLEIVPGATHLFEEPGALEEVARLAADWFHRYLQEASLRLVPAEEWPGFLARFSRQHRAWLTTVERVRPGEDLPIEHAWRPLGSIVPTIDGDRVAAIEVHFQDALVPPYLRVSRPRTLRVDATPEGAERGLEIEDDSGVATRVRFRVTALPETVDHVAPGERRGLRIVKRRQS